MGRCLAGLIFLLSLTGQVCGVSFYGNGFISLRTSGETFHQTSLRMRFRTPKEHGLLFLAAGRRDFLLLELVFGRLQVHFDFGSGEQVLLSQNSIYVSDLAWHSVAVSHVRHNITMTVDRTSHTSLHIPGPDLELNVDVEISIGGTAMYPRHLLNTSKDQPLLNTSTGFRGCLEEAVFNDRNLLSIHKLQDGSLSSRQVSSGCSQEFSASESDSISFFSHKAFVSLPQWEVTEEGVFECELYPSQREEDGIVMYSSGVRGAFVALEIRKGHLVAVAGTSEEKRTELHSLTHLHSSLRWYPVQVHLLQHSVQLNVGKESIKANLGTALKGVQPQGPLYVGGMDTHAWLKFRGSRNGKHYRGSFKGCVRDIRVNNVHTGLPHALVTQDIAVGCKTEQEVTELSISTDDRQELDSHLTDHKSDRTNFLLLRKLEVAEGGWAPLEPKHIKVNLDFRSLGLHPSKLMFHIKQQPVHGQIRLDRGLDLDDKPKEEPEKTVGGRSEGSFSMLDLWQGGVMYVHGGSEDQEDSFVFSVSSSNEKVIVEDQRLHRFVIQIFPVNDAPVLSLPEGNVFSLLEASSRQLTKNTLSVSDPDSSKDDLIFSTVGDLFMEAGYLEHRSQHGRPIHQFSLPDLVVGNILFVHTKAPNSTLTLRVSDGEKVSNTVVLRVVAVALDYRLVNNTGLEVQQGGTTLITTRNLAVGTNAVHQAVLISYEVMEFPKYGSLQRLHSSGDWKPATTFSQKLLHKERIRYVSTYRGPQLHSTVTDQFKCKMGISWRASEEVVVPIVVHWIQLNVTRSKLEIIGIQGAVITSENLRVISNGVDLTDGEVYFRLISTPRKGQLFLVDAVLHSNATFSQKNVTDGMVRYKLLSPSLNDSRDSFSFQVVCSYTQSLNHDFRIIIKPASNITVVNRGLSVMEGESKVITKDILFTQTSQKEEVQYTITISPRHGHLRRINHSNSSFSDNILNFTNQDIAEERILYVHDDSETKMDSFSFKIVWPKRHQDVSDVEKQRSVNISVKLVNDQRPVRVINQVFRVARDGRRLLTLDDLRFQDDDTDFEDGWLVYTRRGIPLGELVLASDTSHKVYEFTQRDLEQKKLLFIHRGVSSGRFVLFVSDGKHYVSTLLEVVAQDPYLKLQRNTGLMVQQGGVVNITANQINIISNLDIRDPKEMIFRVFHPPKHGILYFNDVVGQTELLHITEFTQSDLLSGRLSYAHDGTWELSDGFNVTTRAAEAVTVRQGSKGRWDVHLDFGVSVKIYLESHRRPLTVNSNRPVVVEEGQNVSISKDHLEVIHDGSAPSDIVFRLQNLPVLGSVEWMPPVRNISIRRQQHLNQRVRGQPTTSFSQDDVNRGLIFYHQQVEGGTNDSILLEATNGLSKVGPIRLEVEVIPKLIPLLVSNITLDEGSSLHLTPDVIRVTSRHFSGTNILYRILVPPRHGHLEHSKIPGMPITAFTHTELERKFISYIHDGSEMRSDNFTIMANQTESMKHSVPLTVHINVTPINDESPVVTVNQGLKVWQGSLTGITVDDLSAEDLDTSVDGLEFIITPPSNGYLALQSDPSRQILNFTQSHIQSGMLVFVHSGALTGGFQFQVNDGVNFAPRQIFSTTAQTLMLSLQRCHPLEVYPGSVTPISDQELLVVTNDMRDAARNDSVVFSVTAPPKLGSLVRRSPDNSIQNISTFTQGMVNAGVVLYDQNKLESVGWSASDSFSFTASSSPAFLPPHTFNIQISYQANKHHKNPQQKTRLLNNEGVVVPEGGKVIIDKSKLDASNLLGKVHEQHRKDYNVFYRVISLPRHGTLSIDGRNLTREQPDFSQSTLSKFGIAYLHDDSETTIDSFTFKAWAAPSVLPSSYLSRYSADSSFSPPHSDRPLHQRPSVKMFPGQTEAVTETFNITVTPVNDQPPLLRNRAPSMKVVVGERVVIGPDNLQVEDHDTPPEELHYLVISKPNNGYLTLGERPELVTSFTQYDVNHGRLHFTQQGEPSTGVFYFNVTDGHHRPLYKLFSLEVIKPSISMVNNTGLSLVQGRTAVILTTNQLAAQTNGRSQANITYTVTSHPRHGRIAINDLEVTTFCHDDLKLGRVVYHMTELSESEDRFQVSASATGSGVAYGSVPPQTVVVNVRPLVYLREPVRVPSGIAVKLGKAMIDASELARISRADPVFEVLSPPKHGKLVKMTYDPNRASLVLKSFTYRDVVQGRVAIEETLSDNQSPGNESVLSTTQGHAPAIPLNDSFTFLLKAGNVQPAKGELHFTILPHHQMRHGVSKAEEEMSRKSLTTTQNKTTSEGGIDAADRGDQKRGGGTPHVLSHKNYTRTHHRQRPHSRGGNHTRGHGAKSGSGQEAHGGRHHNQQPNPPPDPQPGQPISVDPYPVHVEVVPRPASDPLLIILPLLACLLLIIILIVLILVFRHRKEKQARLRILQELARVPLPPEGSPYLGRPERSPAMPSVVVTPLGSASCPASPRVPLSPRRKSLAPGMTFWGPFETSAEEVMRETEYMRGFRKARHRSLTPSLKENQYWV
ncbi:LOW QUALITY PROTEIN: chondroitin sulfate proteoglycan 4-like [Synchiropus picturatus]